MRQVNHVRSWIKGQGVQKARNAYFQLYSLAVSLVACPEETTPETAMRDG